MNAVRLFTLAAFAALFAAGCSLPQTDQYTYWRRQPGTNLYEPYTSDHPLTKDEQDQLNVVPVKPAPAQEPEANR
jgi:hypothetical protein